jgi:hypothetical protein
LIPLPPRIIFRGEGTFKPAIPLDQGENAYRINSA